MAAPSTARCRVTMVGDNRAVRVSIEGTPAVLDDGVELRVQPTSGRRLLSHVLRTLVIPQGYTLAIAGSFALAVQRYGQPSALTVYAFVAGAAAAFIGLVVLSSTTIRNATVEPPAAVLALYNGVPLIVLPITGALAHLAPYALLGFFTAGFSAVAAYVAILALFWLVVTRWVPS
jgi:hypothetical protein